MVLTIEPLGMLALQRGLKRKGEEILVGTSL
jgi:hypothetical protein